MPTISLKEDYVGEPPIRHSVEMLDLGDGAFQVVARLFPNQEDWEEGTVLQPGRVMKEFASKKEADLFFLGMLRQFQRLGPP